MEKNATVLEFDPDKSTSTASLNHTPHPKPIILTFEDLNRQLSLQDVSHDIRTREMRYRHYNYSTIHTLYTDNSSDDASDSDTIDAEIITLDDWTSEGETCCGEDEEDEAEIDYGEDESDNESRKDDAESDGTDEDEIDEMILIEPGRDFWTVVK